MDEGCVWRDDARLIVMPEHFHWSGSAPDAAVAALQRERFAKMLRRLSQEFRFAPRIWGELPPAEQVLVRQKQLRTLRYIYLNPCRRGLAIDPLELKWSTYRELLGAAVDPWVPRDRVFRACGWKSDLRTFHRYVSSDPSARVDGTRMPVPAPGKIGGDPSLGLAELSQAALAACRGGGEAEWSKCREVRDLFIHLAREQGWRDTGVLARRTGVTRQTVRNIWRASVSPQAIRAALLCLGDQRLLRGKLQ